MGSYRFLRKTVSQNPSSLEILAHCRDNEENTQCPFPVVILIYSKSGPSSSLFITFRIINPNRIPSAHSATTTNEIIAAYLFNRLELFVESSSKLFVDPLLSEDFFLEVVVPVDESVLLLLLLLFTIGISTVPVSEDSLASEVWLDFAVELPVDEFDFVVELLDFAVDPVEEDPPEDAVELLVAVPPTTKVVSAVPSSHIIVKVWVPLISFCK